MFPLNTWGQKEVKDEWMPKLATGEAIGCFGLTEPNAGSNPGGMDTTAKDNGDHFLINGAKTWITNSPIADLFIVWAKNDAGKIKGYVLTRDMPGIETPPIKGKMSL
jgi:glutaryl-CoA dehydrogenase